MNKLNENIATLNVSNNTYTQKTITKKTARNKSSCVYSLARLAKLWLCIQQAQNCLWMNYLGGLVVEVLHEDVKLPLHTTLVVWLERSSMQLFKFPSILLDGLVEEVLRAGVELPSILPS